MTDEISEKVVIAGADLIGKLLELGGRGLEGLFSSPWTGVPLALIILAQLDPSGKLTIQFLANLSTFLQAVGKVAADAMVQAASAINISGQKVVGPPPITVTVGTGTFCFKFNVPWWLRLTTLAGIVPAEQVCFTTKDARDTALQNIKNQIGALAGFIEFSTTDGP